MNFSKINFSTVLKKILFVVFSSQIIYILIHLQFLLGMSQAALSVQDSILFLVFAIISYILSGTRLKVYFIGLAVVLWPIELQYFYVQALNKPFLLSELYKFTTLLNVSILPLKLLYGSLFILWSYGTLYFIYYAIRNWIKLPIITKIIPLVGIYYCINLFSTTIDTSFWMGDAKQTFFAKGIVRMIRSRPVNTTIILSPELVQENYSLLKQKEKERLLYSISDSPTVIPDKKRPIFMLIFESFYDYKHFLPLFEIDPFPKEYRQLVNDTTYTGPNQSYGSFDARFVSLTGATTEQPSTQVDIPYQTLANILTKYGYTTIALESVNPTYSLPTYYKLWGFNSSEFELFGNDWAGSRIAPNTYEKNITKIINDTPKDIVPFYFGFTYLGHGGAEVFTDRISDPVVDISQFLDFFKDQPFAKQLLKANIFNAERLISIKNMILKKYPDALIIFKVDHYSTELYKSITGTNHIPQELKDNFIKDPTPLPFIVLDGTNGILPLSRGFSPANIPLLILAESKLPYKNTTVSLLAKNVPRNQISIYNKWFERSSNNNFIPILLSETTNQDLFNYNKALKVISSDLYKNDDSPLTLKLLQQNN